MILLIIWALGVTSIKVHLRGKSTKLEAMMVEGRSKLSLRKADRKKKDDGCEKGGRWE